MLLILQNLLIGIKIGQQAVAEGLRGVFDTGMV